MKTEELSKLIIILDFDETLFTKTDPRVLLENNIFDKIDLLKSKGCMFFISSRNPFYLVETILTEKQLTQYFYEIVADYRSKYYHAKEIIYNLSKEKQEIDLIIFIDDFQKNCQEVSKIKGEISQKLLVVNYKNNKTHSLTNIFDILENESFEKLKGISFNQ